MHFQWGYWQMRYTVKTTGSAVALLLLSSCSAVDGGRDGGSVGLEQAPPAVGAPMPGVADFPVKLGSSYQVGNITYTPSDVAAYDEVGYASYYGQELAGRNTANGEVFMPSAVSAAHKTLPMPSYVEVTALDTGRTIIARVNDRGPFANDRLIDLSEGAAKQLGITAQGVAGVRVRKVNPPEQERAVLRNGQMASARINTPESLLKVLREKLGKLPRPKAMAVAQSPVPVRTGPASGSGVRPGNAVPQSRDGRFVREGTASARENSNAAPMPAAGAVGYMVQVASFSSRARADELARKLGAAVVPSVDGRLFRVHLGPYNSETQAQQALSNAQKRGYPQARLYRE
jgi:rare lipoprotein A